MIPMLIDLFIQLWLPNSRVFITGSSNYLITKQGILASKTNIFLAIN